MLVGLAVTVAISGTTPAVTTLLGGVSAGVVATALVAPALAQQGEVQTELVAELRNASPVSVAADGTAVWSSYRPVDRTFRLLLRLPGRQPRVIAEARRGVAFDASAGRSNGRSIVVWSACRVAPRAGVTLGGLADYATGRSCRLRMFDVKRGTTRTLRTGDGSAFLPTVSSGGSVVYFRSHAGRTSIIRQSLSGKRRMSLTRVSGVPTSLAATSDHVAWTSGRVDRFGGIETSLRRRDIKRRQTAVIERRIVADGAGVQVAGVRIVGASIAGHVPRVGVRGGRTERS